MNCGPSVCFLAPQGLPGMLAHHEATSGMGALVPPPGNFLYPQHTLASCVAAVREQGIRPSVLDPTGQELTLREVLRRLNQDAGVLAVLVSADTALADGNMLRLVRQAAPGRKILLFGPSAHLVAPGLLAEGLAEAALCGEPEGAISETILGVADGQLQGELRTHALRPDRYDGQDLLIDLDQPPPPAWDAVAWYYYGMVSLLSSRGCPAGCRYCAYTEAQGVRFRHQSVERTLREWEWLAREVRPSYLLIRDPVFAHDRARVEALCQGIIARSIQIPWACESRPEHFDRQLLALMKDAGCVTVKIGAESGDPDCLRAIGRLAQGQSGSDYLGQVQQVAAGCAELDIRCRVFVMAGLPGQTAASLTRTRKALSHLPVTTNIHARAYHAYPGLDLAQPAAPLLPETLRWLEAATQPRPPVWKRAVRAARSRFPARLMARSRAAVGSERASPVAVRDTSTKPEPVLQPDALAGRRIFLTGGNGFLGGHVARALVAAGAQVVALVRPGSHLGELEDLRAIIVRGDLTQPTSWAHALRGCDLCFHVAARFGAADQAAEMYAVNVGGTSALMAACAAMDVRRVVHTSTIGTVGRPEDPAKLPDEDTAFNLWDQASDYVKSKYLGELAARSWNAAGLEVVIVKPTAPVGPGDGRPTATGRRILAALRGEAIIYPPGGINHVPVQDVAAGHLLAALRGTPGRTYILGHAAGNLSLKDFRALVASVAGVPMSKARGQPAHSGYLPAALTDDPSRAIRELGLPQSDLVGAFAAAVAWYREQGKPWPH